MAWYVFSMIKIYSNNKGLKMNKKDFKFMSVGSEIILKGKSLKFLRSFNDFKQIELVGINKDY